MTSRPFTIERRALRFLIGGGASATRTDLLVEGKKVRTASGEDRFGCEILVANIPLRVTISALGVSCRAILAPPDMPHRTGGDGRGRSFSGFVILEKP